MDTNIDHIQRIETKRPFDRKQCVNFGNNRPEHINSHAVNISNLQV